MEKSNFTEWLEKVSDWSKEDLQNALWAFVSDEKNTHNASIKVADARDFLMDADPDDAQNFERLFERLFEILGYQKNGLPV